MRYEAEIEIYLAAVVVVNVRTIMVNVRTKAE